MVDINRILEEFLQLVQVYSASGQERQIADLLKEKLVNMGLNVTEDNAGGEVGATAGNIVATLAASDPGRPALLLSAHMDTVEPGRGVRPMVKDGIIRSAGDTILGADDKAGIVAILEAIRVIKEQQIPHGDLEIVFTIWEEGGLLGAKNLDHKGLKAGFGFVLDSDGPPGTIVVQAPSQDRISATVHGRAAHAGINPETGINAIQVASHAIASMKIGRLDEETTANIGLISGGKAINIVPDSTSVIGEVRSLNRAKRKSQTEAICAALKESANKFGTTVDIVVQTLYEDFNLSESDPPVKLAMEAARKMGLKPSLEKTGGGSDANIFNQKGITVANLGIAMQKVHTTEEFIRVEDLINNARYLVEIIGENK